MMDLSHGMNRPRRDGDTPFVLLAVEDGKVDDLNEHGGIVDG